MSPTRNNVYPMPEPVTLSVAIIVKNEEKNIERCLRAVEPVADEIIVVDSGSTDRTEVISKQFSKVKFIKTPWLGFGLTKQAAVDLCTSDWILAIDADEVLSDSLADSIHKLKRQGFETGKAYQFPRLTNYCGQWIRHCGWYPDLQLRLFSKKTGQWSSDIVHEQVLLAPGTKVLRVKGDLLHFSYENLSDHMKRIDHYSTLGAEKIIADGKKLLIFRGIVQGKFRFFKTYFLKLGFLDGKAGLVISLFASWMVFLKYAKASARKGL